MYVPYNILPLDPDSKNHAIMRYPEVCNILYSLSRLEFPCLELDCGNIILLAYYVVQIQAAVSALRNIRGLPWPKGHKKKDDDDILDWLRDMFGFQVK